MIYAHSYKHLSIPAAVAGLENRSGGNSAALHRARTTWKILNFLKEPNRKAVFRFDGGPSKFCYRSLQKTFDSEPTFTRQL